MVSLRLDHLRFAFSGGPPVVDDISLELAAGEFFCLLGQSGSGKSTLLRLVGGYFLPQSGAVWLNGRDVTTIPPEKRNVGMVFQNYALFPHLDALDNVAFGLRAQRVPRAAREKRAHEILDWVGLQTTERRRLPSQLSGGQQQRVALARALAFNPCLLMLDEPFANLDRALRERLREETREVQRRAGITTILVTHDRDEALSLGDRVAVMHQGKLLQVDTPEKIYREPNSLQVARFLGHRNVLDAEDARRCGLTGSVVLWPERLRLRQTGNFPGTIRRVAFAGSHRVVTLQLDAGPQLAVHTEVDSRPQAGDRVGLEIPPDAVTEIPSSTDGPP